MENTIGYCGLDCTGCLIFTATREKNTKTKQEMKLTIISKCYEHYGKTLKPEEITNCDGCKANTGRLFASCANCEIRECAESKNISICAFCENYKCDQLKDLFLLDPSAEKRLDEIRKNN